MIYTVEVPKSLRDCADMPNRPSGTYTQREVAVFITRLDAARIDCKSKLQTLVGSIDKQNANAVRIRDKSK